MRVVVQGVHFCGEPSDVITRFCQQRAVGGSYDAKWFPAPKHGTRRHELVAHDLGRMWVDGLKRMFERRVAEDPAVELGWLDDNRAITARA